MYLNVPFEMSLQLIQPDVSISRLSDKLSNVTVLFCMEVWKSDDGKPDGKNLTHRGVFSLIVACLQYLLPLLIVLGIYGLIYRFLREQQYPRHLRQNKTNALLASISITHCIIWLPFSVFNILADLWPDTVSLQSFHIAVRVRNIFCRTTSDSKLDVTSQTAADTSFMAACCPHCSKYSFFVQKFNFDFARNCRFFWGGKTRENFVVLDFLAVDKFDFMRKIVKKILGEKLVKM